MDFAERAHAANAGRFGGDFFWKIKQLCARLLRAGALGVLAIALFFGALLIAAITAGILLVAAVAGLAGRLSQAGRWDRQAYQSGTPRDSDGEILEARRTAHGWMVDPRRS